MLVEIIIYNDYDENREDAGFIGEEMLKNKIVITLFFYNTWQVVKKKNLQLIIMVHFDEEYYLVSIDNIVFGLMLIFSFEIG